MTESAVHAIALVKGAVEGDPHKHFGSLLGYEQHLIAAVGAGLVVLDGEATDRGVAFYKRHGLETLPDGRANYWDADRLYDAASELTMLSRT